MYMYTYMPSCHNSYTTDTRTAPGSRELLSVGVACVNTTKGTENKRQEAGLEQEINEGRVAKCTYNVPWERNPSYGV